MIMHNINHVHGLSPQFAMTHMKAWRCDTNDAKSSSEQTCVHHDTYYQKPPDRRGGYKHPGHEGYGTLHDRYPTIRWNSGDRTLADVIALPTVLGDVGAVKGKHSHAIMGELISLAKFHRVACKKKRLLR
ncbi:hypothetical protein K1719_006893 [Acacia pycnantha]|nr:hypothetical protein K1719_006893 [Acacia pycnantha]